MRQLILDTREKIIDDTLAKLDQTGMYRTSLVTESVVQAVDRAMKLGGGGGRMKKDVPRVCANCKWACLKPAIHCRRYPYSKDTGAAHWCGEFALAIHRERRYDLPYPEYQEVDNA